MKRRCWFEDKDVDARIREEPNMGDLLIDLQNHRQLFLQHSSSLEWRFVKSFFLALPPASMAGIVLDGTSM